MHKLIISAALATALAATASAQTVTVAKTGTPDFATVQAAIDSFTPDPDGGVANVIQITDSALYDEVVTIDVPITIEGTGGSAPVIALQTNPNANSGGDCGLVFEISTGTFNDVTLRNLIFIPSLVATPPDDGLKSTGQNLNILIEDCVVTANDGADGPLNTDGVTFVDETGATKFGDDGAFLGTTSGGAAGDGTVVTIRNTVFTQAGPGDGLVCSGTSEGAYILEEGSIFSYFGRLGLQVNGSFIIDSPDDHVLILGNLGFAGIWCAGTGSSATPERTFDGVDVIDNAGWGIEQQNGGDLPFSLSNAIIAGNGYVFSPTVGSGLLIGDVGVTAPITISDVTIVDNATDPIAVNASATSDITITDSIIGGPNQIVHDGTGTMSINFSALQTDGSLVTPGYTGTGTVTESNVINDDINFFDTGDPSSADFYDIVLATTDVSNPYRTADSVGGVLTGGAGSEEVTVTSVDSFDLYR